MISLSLSWPMSLSFLFFPHCLVEEGKECGWVSIWPRSAHLIINHTFLICIWAVVSRTTLRENAVDSFRFHKWYWKLRIFEKEMTDLKLKPLAPFPATAEMITLITCRVPHITIYVEENVMRKKIIQFNWLLISHFSICFLREIRHLLQVLQEAL